MFGQKYLLRLRPRPLIDPNNKIILVWSPKSACTSAVIWFFKVSGLYDEALAYDRWPHKYRQKVYYTSDMCLQGMADDFSKYRIVRVIRDPYERAISSYRHALMSGYVDKRMAAFLGRDIVAERSFSLVDFLSCIETKSLLPVHSNTHFAIQLQPFEQVYPANDVINVSRQNLHEELNRIEGEMGLETTDFSTLEWLELAHKGGRRQKAKPYDSDASRLSLTELIAAKGPWPVYSDFLTDSVRAHIRRLYAADFDAFEPYL